MYEVDAERINKRIVSNIDVILKMKKKLKKEFEDSIGVSAGYISKIPKLSQKSNFPGLNILLNIANELEISLENLLFFDFSQASSLEVENIEREFLKQIINDTKQFKIIWRHKRIDLLEYQKNAYRCTKLSKYVDSQEIEEIHTDKRYEACINESIKAEIFVYDLLSDNEINQCVSILFHFLEGQELFLECPNELFIVIESSVVDENDVIYAKMRDYVNSRKTVI